MQLVFHLRNGAILATLTSIPVLVGLVWSLAWGETRGVSTGTIVALLLAWLAATGVVTALSFNIVGAQNEIAWSYPCTNCQRPVYLFQYHCSNCGTQFAAPPQAYAFRNALLFGIAVFYATFGLGAFLLRF
jgi:DNA-directed RNA polymerase subunit RPC12/RpoP